MDVYLAIASPVFPVMKLENLPVLFDVAQNELSNVLQCLGPLAQQVDMTVILGLVSELLGG